MAAEHVMDRVAATGKTQTMDEYVDAVLDEADALERRREMTLIKTCPHCGEALNR